MADINDQALEWAKSNPDDPRAQDVMAKAWANQNPDDPRSAQIHAKFETPQTSPTVGSTLYNKAADLGKSALEGAKNVGKAAIEDTSDLGRGLVQGVSLGGSDEALAAAKATAGAKIGSPQWVDLYKKYQALEQGKNKAAQERSPILYGTGQVGGMLAPAVLTAGATAPEELGALAAGKMGAKQLGSLALKGAATGAGIGGVSSFLGSEQGKLIGATPEQQSALAADTVNGAATGAAVGGVLSPVAKYMGSQGSLKDYLKTIALAGGGGALTGAGIGAVTPGLTANQGAAIGGLSGAAIGLGLGPKKMEKLISGTEQGAQAIEGRNIGLNGINASNESQISGPIGNRTGLRSVEEDSARKITDMIYDAKQQVGETVGKALDDATNGTGKYENNPVIIDVTKPMLDSVNKFKDLLQNDKTLLANPAGQKLYDTIFQMGDFDASNLTPKEVQSLRDDTIDFANSIKTKEPGIANLGFQFQGQLRNALGDAIPEYNIAAKRYDEINTLLPETLISGATPVDIKGVKLSNLKNGYNDVFQKLKNIIRDSRMPGSSRDDARKTLDSFIDGINTFEQNDLSRINSGEINPEDAPQLISTNPGQSKASAMNDYIKKQSDTSAFLQQVKQNDPNESAKKTLFGTLTGRGSLLNASNKVGLAENKVNKIIKQPTELVHDLYNASESQLRDIGQQMSNIPGIASVGKALTKGLDSKDSMSVNAAIFSIMQNPQARLLINAQDLKNKGDQE